MKIKYKFGFSLSLYLLITGACFILKYSTVTDPLNVFYGFSAVLIGALTLPRFIGDD